MKPKKEKRVLAKWIQAMEEYSNVMARDDMGGNEGIHKPTSGNPDRLRR